MSVGTTHVSMIMTMSMSIASMSMNMSVPVLPSLCLEFLFHIYWTFLCRESREGGGGIGGGFSGSVPIADRSPSLLGGQEDRSSRFDVHLAFL